MWKACWNSSEFSTTSGLPWILTSRSMSTTWRGREVAHAAPQLHQRCQLVTARAVGKATELLNDAEELLQLNGIFLCLKGQAYPTDERDDFLAALPKHGFELLEEHRIALDEDDPDRWAILALKTEEKNPKKPSAKKQKHHKQHRSDHER